MIVLYNMTLTNKSLILFSALVITLVWGASTTVYGEGVPTQLAELQKIVALLELDKTSMATPIPTIVNATPSGAHVFILKAAIDNSLDCTRVHECITPYSMTIHKGETVAWKNESWRPQQVISGMKGVPTYIFESGGILQNHVFIHTFDTVGVYQFFNPIQTNLSGVIVVLP